MVRLDDQHGRFWMEDHPEHNRWSDVIEYGHRFPTRESADHAAAKAQASADKRSDWFPRIKVVRFT